MGRTSSSRIAGQSLLTCAPYSATKTRRLPMFLRSIDPNSRKNERTFTSCADAGRRIFRKQPLYGPFVPSRVGCCRGTCSLRRGRIGESASIQLLMALCLCIFLHPLCGLLFLDNRPSCHRRGMVGSRAPSVGKSRGIVRGLGVAFCANSFPPPPSLCMDGHSSRSGGLARFQTRLSQLGFLSRARRVVFRLLYFRIALLAQAVRATGRGRKSALHDLDAKGRVYQSADVCALSYLRRVRLADEPELPLVFNHVWRVHLRGRSRQLDVLAGASGHGFAASRLLEGCRHARALSHHGEMDVRVLRFLGLYRLRPIHAHLVCKHAGGDAVFHHPKHRVLVGTEHAPGGRTFLRAICDFTFALDQKGTAPALLRGGMDRLHANARHVPRRLARVTWHGRACEHLGFAFAHRHRRHPWLRFSATRTQDFSLSSPRSALDCISEISQLKWLTPNLFARLFTRGRRCPRGSGSSFFSLFLV